MAPGGSLAVTKKEEKERVKDKELKEKAKEAERLKEAARPKTVRELNALAVADLVRNLTLLNKLVQTNESRFASRVLRQTANLRRRLNGIILSDIINEAFPPTHDSYKFLLKYVEADRDAEIASLPEPMEVDPVAENPPSSSSVPPTPAVSGVVPVTPLVVSSSVPATPALAVPAIEKHVVPKLPPTYILPEAEVYLHLLVVIYLLDKHRHAEAVDCVTRLSTVLQSFNRRTLDALAAKAYYYYSRAFELTGKQDLIRPTLHAILRTATLRHDLEIQATVINILLRNYLSFNLVDQAVMLVSKAEIPETASNNELARNLYLKGRLNTIQLNYSEAKANLETALRKVPPNSAAGFHQAANKLLVIVQLLIGEIPSRSLFRQPMLRKSLQAYLELTQSVRIGDLAKFSEVVQRHQSVFQADKNYTLILRLRHNVIKTGIRMINTSYSRISLADVAAKLGLENADEAEHIVAKAVRDGVADASINHEQGAMYSKELTDIYSTNEPQNAFDDRINFCLKIYNDTVKALSFPPNAHQKGYETAAERRKRLQAEQEELEMEMEDEE